MKFNKNLSKKILTSTLTFTKKDIDSIKFGIRRNNIEFKIGKINSIIDNNHINNKFVLILVSDYIESLLKQLNYIYIKYILYPE